MRKHALRHACTSAVALLLTVALSAACDSSSADKPPSSTSPTTPSSSPQTDGPLQADLHVERWGYTADGLLSVIVRNDGPGVLRSARAIIMAKDADDDLVASLTAPPKTYLGTRCCTIIGLEPGQSYGLYSKIAVGDADRIDHVEMRYSSVRISETALQSPVVSLENPSLTTNSKGARVEVAIKTSSTAGPYFTVQAQLHRSDGKFLGIISSGFFCIKAGVQKTVGLDFFHPVPRGATVDHVASFPLDEATAKLERLDACN